jgi:hypothetical protein
MLFYPVRDEDEPSNFTTMGFALQFPKSNISVPIKFGVKARGVVAPGDPIE